MSDHPQSNGKPKGYKGRKRGPKTKWGKVDPVKVAVLAAKLGGTDAQIAAALGVTPQTLRNWMRERKQLFCGLEAAKAQKDERVVRALFERATGYKAKATKIMVVDGQVRKVPYKEQYPPDTAAAIFWLKNRSPDRWRDKAESVISNPDGTAVQGNTTVIAPQVVFVLPEKDQLGPVTDVEATTKTETNGGNGHALLGLPEKDQEP